MPSRSNPPAATFEEVRWDDLQGRRPRVGWRTAGFLLTVAGAVVAFCYDHFVLSDLEPLWRWDVARHEWLFVVSLSAFGFYVLAPLATNRRETMRYWRRLRGRRPAVAALAYLVVFFLGGLLGPVVLGVPQTGGRSVLLPPYGVSIPQGFAVSCAGSLADGACHGTLAHPFGTDGVGRDVLVLVVNGMRVALEVALVTATILVPIATAVGVAAATFGGRVDDALMRYVDLQGAIPAFFVYLVAQYVFRPSLLLMVVVFGLLNWGGVARLVRAETLKKREAGYVTAARGAGAGRLWTIREHLLPNVSTTVLTAATLQMPTLIIIEAALSYLNLADPYIYSWGNAISVSARTFPVYWWVTVIPVAFLLLTTLSFSLLGDALRDVFDARIPG